MYKGHAPKRKGRRQSEKFGDRRGSCGRGQEPCRTVPQCPLSGGYGPWFLLFGRCVTRGACVCLAPQELCEDGEGTYCHLQF